LSLFSFNDADDSNERFSVGNAAQSDHAEIAPKTLLLYASVPPGVVTVMCSPRDDGGVGDTTSSLTVKSHAWLFW
jgi:hypothetical protein